MAQPTRDSTEPAEGPVTFGRYTIIARLGSGGMAEALLAMLHGDLGFQKLVVLKRMHPQLGRDEHFVKMFLHEARLAARLNHPNVVATTEVGEVEGVYFIAMEYLEGLSLDRILRKYLQDGGLVPLGPLARTICDALEGLHHAHDLRDFDGRALGVVHRDVTPSNLFVTYDGIAKLLDFGIAKASLSDDATRTGTLKGKLAYMAPEQFYNTPIDRRADIWSMGVLLWEMTTGRRLFKGPNDAVTYKNLTSMPVPSVTRFRPEAPRSLDVVLAKALERDREVRFPTAEAFRKALEEVIQKDLQGISRDDVAAELKRSFGDILDENRAIIRAFARPDAVEIEPLGLSSTGQFKPGGGLTLPPTKASVSMKDLGIAPLGPIGASATPYDELEVNIETVPKRPAIQPGKKPGGAPDLDRWGRTVTDTTPQQQRQHDGDEPRPTMHDGTPEVIGAKTRPGARPPDPDEGDSDTIVQGRGDLFGGRPPQIAAAPAARPGTPALGNSAMNLGGGETAAVNIVGLSPTDFDQPGVGVTTHTQPSGAMPPAVPAASTLQPVHVSALGVFPPAQTAFSGPTQAPTAAYAAGATEGGRARLLGWLLVLGVMLGLGAGVALSWDSLGPKLREIVSPTIDPGTTGTFRLRIVSIPPRAKVYEQGQEIGITPMELPVLRREVLQAPRTFVLRHPACQDSQITQGNSPHATVELQVRLPVRAVVTEGAVAPRR